MTVEQIAIRQEIRQMLNEAGINKNTMKEIVREVIDEELHKAVRQVMHEMDLDSQIYNLANGNLKETVRHEIKVSVDRRVKSVFDRMKISIDVRNVDGNSILSPKQDI
jgi:hypothetical protein